MSFKISTEKELAKAEIQLKELVKVVDSNTKQTNIGCGEVNTWQLGWETDTKLVTIISSITLEETDASKSTALTLADFNRSIDKDKTKVSTQLKVHVLTKSGSMRQKDGDGEDKKHQLGSDQATMKKKLHLLIFLNQFIMPLLTMANTVLNSTVIKLKIISIKFSSNSLRRTWNLEKILVDLQDIHPKFKISTWLLTKFKWLFMFSDEFPKRCKLRILNDFH